MKTTHSVLFVFALVLGVTMAGCLSKKSHQLDAEERSKRELATEEKIEDLDRKVDNVQKEISSQINRQENQQRELETRVQRAAEAAAEATQRAESAAATVPNREWVSNVNAAVQDSSIAVEDLYRKVEDLAAQPAELVAVGPDLPPEGPPATYEMKYRFSHPSSLRESERGRVEFSGSGIAAALRDFVLPEGPVTPGEKAGLPRFVMVELNTRFPEEWEIIEADADDENRVAELDLAAQPALSMERTWYVRPLMNRDSPIRLELRGKDTEADRYETIGYLEDDIMIEVTEDTQKYAEALKVSFSDVFTKGIATWMFTFIAGIFTSLVGIRTLKGGRKEAAQGAK